MANTKERILDTTAQLFQRYGYTGTGLKQIVAAANAPFGSIYHHFPNGKAQLGEEVIRRSGQMYKELFEAIFDAAPDVETATRNFFVGAAETLRLTDYADACPIEDHWIDGGRTQLERSLLLCRHPPRLAHEGGWTIEFDAHGDVRILRYPDYFAFSG